MQPTLKPAAALLSFAALALAAGPALGQSTEVVVVDEDVERVEDPAFDGPQFFDGEEFITVSQLPGDAGDSFRTVGQLTFGGIDIDDRLFVAGASLQLDVGTAFFTTITAEADGVAFDVLDFTDTDTDDLGLVTIDVLDAAALESLIRGDSFQIDVLTTVDDSAFTFATLESDGLAARLILDLAVIPSPTAAGAGLAGMAALSLVRRRR